ncbi:hypothetical protein [Mesomycoplasma dispar]|uniref:Uncharacterized protein n=1 Tax=Mesomycoplasma dispar TaxID=86660 RepID=A0ABN5DW33_9BACT|nr:hypothetical protein [Mesomycoplasma dispar]ATP59753.1 hypothetical protein CSW10_02295 [Mesomycoplasma dispar]
MPFNSFTSVFILTFIPILTFLAISGLNFFIWFKARTNYFIRNVFRRIKVLNKNLDILNCNFLFQKGLSKVGEITRKNNQYIIFNLIFCLVFSVSEFTIFWILFFDPENLFLFIFLLGMASFSKFLFAFLIFATIYVSKKMIKTAENRIEKWKFDNKSFHFDREYQPNGKKTKNLIAFVNPGQRAFLFSSEYFQKHLKNSGFEIFYFIIWGIHFPFLRNVKFESLDIYQDFVNLYRKAG